jgi:galactose mutarotase-like enzyme
MTTALTTLQLENEYLSLSILPEVGAKILTLFDKKRERQLLWENRRIRPPTYPIDANFDNHWCGGWDDAYPCADACVHKGELFPNLGELRSLTWKVEDLRPDAATLSAYGPISAIHATKTVTLRDRVVEMRFAIRSLSPIPIDFLWGTHPALAVEAGTRLILPPCTGIVAQSNDLSLGLPGEEYRWPFLHDRDMSVVPDISSGLHCGHYAKDLEDGWFAVETRGHGIVFDFPLETCPYLWMWLVYGGWRGYHHAVIEPWTGYPVKLDEAYEENRHSILRPGETFTATIRCTTYSAPETHNDGLNRLRTQ